MMPRREGQWTREIRRHIKSAAHRRSEAIDSVLSGRYIDSAEPTREGSVWKQIDENRELLSLLRKLAPDLLRTHPAIEACFAHRDAWLTDLAQASEIENAAADDAPLGWPRPWPGTEPLIERLLLYGGGVPVAFA